MKPAKDNREENNSSDKAGTREKSNSGQAAGSSSKNGGKKEGKRDFRGNRRWRKGRDRNRDRNRERKDENRSDSDSREEKKEKVLYTCEICGKDIKDISTAIASAGTQNPVHFDCMIEKLKNENPLEKTDKVVYLGSGSFGIVRQEKNKPAKEFTIIKKFEVENKDEKPDWRTGQVKVK